MKEDLDWLLDRQDDSKPEPTTPESVAATSSLVWGVIAMFAWPLPPLGMLAALAGLVRGRQGWNARDGDRARLGVVLSTIALMMSVWLTGWIIVVTCYSTSGG